MVSHATGASSSAQALRVLAVGSFTLASALRPPRTATAFASLGSGFAASMPTGCMQEHHMTFPAVAQKML
jgi:hypothetical protein